MRVLYILIKCSFVVVVFFRSIKAHIKSPLPISKNVYRIIIIARARTLQARAVCTSILRSHLVPG